MKFLYSKFNRRGFTTTPTFTKSCSEFILSVFSNKICSINFYNRKLMRGFTLIELLVAVTIFSTAVVIGVGALYSAQQINIKLQSTRIIMDSLNLSLEVMIRNMRYGSNFYCGTGLSDITSISSKNCPYVNNDNTSGGGSIVFRPINGSVNDRVSYYIDNNKHLMETVSNNGIILTNGTKQISSDDIIIDNLRFYIVGANKSPVDTDQPMVTMTISGRTKNSKSVQEINFTLQSSITTRNSD